MALATAMVAGAMGCGNGDGGGVRGSGTSASEAREVESFTKVESDGAADIVVSIGEPQSVMVETDDNLLALLETDVRGDTLRIRFRDRVRSTAGLDVAITVPALEDVTINGAADVEIEGASGGNLGFTINGAASIYATGKVDRVDVDINGAGDVQLFELVAETVDISISGNGDVEVHATRSLSARLSGSGQVVYDGDPAEVDTSVTGSGSIERR
ncbi:MAG: head GIN domain-containing protein [Gaiellaceae bacterium]